MKDLKKVIKKAMGGIPTTNEEVDALIIDTGIGDYISHPILHTLFPLYGMINDVKQTQEEAIAYAYKNTLEMFQGKLEMLEGAIDEGNWSFIFGIIIEKPYRLTFLKTFVKLLPADAVNDVVSSVWSSIENPSNIFAMNELLPLFDKVNAKFPAGTPKTLTVYRGINTYDVDEDEIGMAWSLDKEKAEWFATRFNNETPYLLTATISKSKALAYYGGRGESEVVVNPKYLQGLSIEEITA